MSGPTAQEFAALQAQMTALQQQLAQLQAPPPPPPAPAPPPPIPEAAKPQDFDGRSETLERFIHQCSLFLDLDNYTDRAKITFVLSYMKSGSALTWAEQKLAEYAATNWVQTWAPFLAELRTSFGDVDRTKSARIRIFEIKQTGSVDDYNVKFMSEHQLTGFSDEASLEIWKKGLKSSVLRRIYNEAAEPTDFAAWRARASHYDRVDRELQSRSIPTSSSSSSKARHIPVTSSSKPTSTSTPTTTASAPVKVKQERVDPAIASQRMEKGQCILCGSSDHWANVCPKRITAPVQSSHKTQGRGRGGYNKFGKKSSGSSRTVNTVNKTETSENKDTCGST